MISTLVSRVVRYYRRQGLLSLLREACLRPYRRLALNWNYVFVCEVAPDVSPPPADWGVRHCRTSDELPDALRQQIIEQLGPAMGPTLEVELAGRAELFLALIDEQVAAIQYVRLGRDIRRWFVPLRPNDAVLFGGTTLPRFRGRGVITWMIRHQTCYALQHGGRAYADVKIWNTPPIRALERVGYRRIARMRPLRSER